MLINENFYRCSECDNAYFKIKKTHLLRKAEGDRKPPIESTRTIYICDNCGETYNKEELNNG